MVAKTAFIFSYSFVCAQTVKKIRIISCENGTPVAYATVVNKSSNRIVLSDKNGYADCSSTDTLEIRSLGYGSLEVFNPSDSICMKEKAVSFQDVEIIAKENEYYELSQQVIKSEIGNVPVGWGPFIEECIEIENKLSNPVKIYYLRVPFLSFAYPDSGYKFPAYRVRIYKIESGEKEIKPIIFDTLYVSARKAGYSKESVDLSQFSLLLKKGDKILVGLCSYEWSGGYYNYKTNQPVYITEWRKNELISPWGTRILKTKNRKKLIVWSKNNKLGGTWSMSVADYAPVFEVLAKPVK